MVTRMLSDIFGDVMEMVAEIILWYDQFVVQKLRLHWFHGAAGLSNCEKQYF